MKKINIAFIGDTFTYKSIKNSINEGFSNVALIRIDPEDLNCIEQCKCIEFAGVQVQEGFEKKKLFPDLYFNIIKRIV